MESSHPEPARSELSATFAEVQGPSEKPQSWFLWKLWLAAFIVRVMGLGFGLLFFPGWLVPPDTEGLYYPIARSLAAGSGYQVNGDFVEASRSAPILPCWLAVLMWFAGSDLPAWVAGLFNAAFRATTVVLVFVLARRYFGHVAALCAAMLYLFDPWEAFWVGFVMKESLAVPLFLFAVWQFCRFDDERSIRSALMTGAVVGLATLARFPSLALCVAPALLFLPMFRQWRNWPALRKAVATLGCLAFGLIAVLSPWLLRNWGVLGQPVLTPHFAGQKFYTGNGPGIEMQQDGYYSPKGIDQSLLQEAHRERPPWQREGHLFTKTMLHMVTHPGEAVERMATKFVNMWRPTFAQSSFRNWLLLGIPYCIWMIVSLTGLALAIWKRTMARGVLIPLILFFCIHLIFWGEIRNRQYLTPLLFIFGGVALEQLIRRLGNEAIARPRPNAGADSTSA